MTPIATWTATITLVAALGSLPLAPVLAAGDGGGGGGGGGESGGAVHASELEYLRGVARIFGFDRQAFERIRATHVEPKGVDPFDILGISRGATDAEIKKNHPDTLIAKGLPQEFVDIANEKMAAINAAYDDVERERGLR